MNSADSKNSNNSATPSAKTGNWKRMQFKGNKVWMATDPKGAPESRNGKVLIKYQLEQDYEYWVHKRNVLPIDSAPEKMTLRKKSRSKKKERKVETATDKVSRDDSGYEGKICLFTDGASSGNPGPSGIGVLLRYGGHEKEISKFIGNATNNIAELKAIEIGLSALTQTDIPVRLFTDSKYAYGLLVLNWKPKKNRQIVEAIKKTMSKFRDLEIIKVKGHSGVPENERADFLATSAIKKSKMK
jgi:ribonuclease HI